MTNKTDTTYDVSRMGDAPEDMRLADALRGKAKETIGVFRRFFTPEGSLAVPPDAKNTLSGAVMGKIAKRALAPIARVLGMFALSVLFALTTLGYDMQPAGLALLCATGICVPAVLAGAVTALLWMGQRRILYGSALFLAVGIRYAVGRCTLHESSDAEAQFTPRGDDLLAWLRRAVFPPEVWEQSITARVGISLIAACVVAAGMLLGEGFSVACACRAVYFLCAVPMLTYFFCGVIGGRGVSAAPALREGGIGALCGTLTASFGGYMVLGFSLKLLAAHLITLYISRKGGFLRGCVCGLLCGVACDTLYAPAYALIGGISGVFWSVHPAPAVVISLLAGSAYAVYVGEFSAIRSVVPEMLASAAIAYPIIRYIKLPDLFYGTSRAAARSRDGKKEEQESGTAAAVSAIPPELLGIPPLADQLDALSGILNGLSATFYHLSDCGKKPGLAEIKAMCESTADRYCAVCPKRGVCWEEDFSATAEAMGRITLSVHKKGRIEVSRALAPLDTRCEQLPKMLADIGEAAAILCESRIDGDKIEVAAADYEGMARLLRASAEESAHAAEEDPVLSKRLGRAMARLGFRAKAVHVLGKRRRTVVAEGIDLGLSAAAALDGEGVLPGSALRGSTLLGTEELRAAFSALAGVTYQPPDYAFTEGGKNIVMTMRAVPQISLTAGCWGEKKPGEEVSGDALSVFSNRSDYFYALLCDGMGSGREASVTAQIAALFLEKLLSVSTAKGAALNLLNGFLRSRKGECSATVDLCEVDLLTREAHFVKCGAAATFLLRGEHLFRIASGTMPLGILKEVAAEETTVLLERGDLLLFFSDGVCGECEDSGWILSAVRDSLARAAAEALSSSEAPDSPQGCGADSPKASAPEEERLRKTAAFLGAAAKERLGRRDDMTVVIVGVKGV